MQAALKVHYTCILRFLTLGKQCLTNNLTYGDVKMCHLMSNHMVLGYKAQQVKQY